jgi:hypothetical protein
MVRNHKPLIVAAIAVAALGVLQTPDARAAAFHCSVEPCRYTVQPTGSVPSTEAHQNFMLYSPGASLSFTCNQLTGEATSATGNSSELTLSNLAYDGCSGSVVRTNSCDYKLAAVGTLSVACPPEKRIELEFTSGILSGCIYSFGSQGPQSGLTFTSLKPSGRIRVDNVVENLSMGSNKPGCEFYPTATIKFWTANFILTGETDPGGVTAKAWFE